tara:strand:- start:446 stop:3502 length:3057 start_codon:yes stop_codon:yes gene_type:complete
MSIPKDPMDQQQSLLDAVQKNTTLGVTEIADSTPTINEPENALPKEVEVAWGGAFSKIKPKPKVDVDSVVDAGTKKVEPSFEGISKVEQGIYNKDVDLSDMSVLKKYEDASTEGTGYINFSYIENDDGIKQVLNATADLLKKNKSVSFDETVNSAQGYDWLKTIKNKNLFDANVPLSTQITAARYVLTDSANQLNLLAQKIVKNKTNGIIDENMLVEFRRASALHSAIQYRFKGMQSEVARTLNAFKIPIETPGSLNTYTNVHNYTTELLSDYGGAETTVKMAEQYLDLANKNGQRAADHYIQGGALKKTVEALQEAYQGGIMWSTKTLTRNFFGSFIYSAMQVPEKILTEAYKIPNSIAQIGINNIRNTKVVKYLMPGEYWGASKNGADFQRAYAYVQGYFGSFFDSVRVANQSFKSNKPSDAASKWEVSKSNKMSADYLGATGYWGKAIDFYGKASGVPFKLMLWQDEFMKNITRSAETRIQAYDVYKQKYDFHISEGKTAEEANTLALPEAQKFLDGDIPEDKLDEINEATQTVVFQNGLSDTMKKVQALQSVPGMKFFMPFLKTPVNIFNTVLRYHGVEGFKEATGIFGNRFWKDAEYRSNTMAKLSLTASFWGTSAYLYSNGRITGAAPTDRKYRQLLRDAGWQPYSFVFPDPNLPEGVPLFDSKGIPTGQHKYFSYAGFEPLGAFFAISSSTYEKMARSNDPTLQENYAMAATMALFDYTKQLPYLQTLGNIYQALDRDYVNFDQFTQTIMQGFVPFSAQMRAVDTFFDPTIKDYTPNFELNDEPYLYDKDGKILVDEEGQQIINPNYGLPTQWKTYMSINSGMNKVLDLLPGSQNIIEFPVQLDDFGNEKTKDYGLNVGEKAWNWTIPFNISKGRPIDTAGIYEVFALGNPIQQPKPGQTYKGIKLTGEQRVFLVNAATNDVMIGAKDFDTAIEAILFTSKYRNSNVKEQYSILQSLKNEYYQKAWDENFKSEYPDVWDISNNRNNFINDGLITPHMIGESYSDMVQQGSN